VKVATPHFGESTFSGSKLNELLDKYLNELQCNTLETVQWMARIDLKKEDERLSCLQEQHSEIETVVSALKSKGAINRFGCFPYTPTFRDQVITYDWCDVILDYYNPMENTDFPFKSLRETQSFIAIRPFFPVLQNDPAKYSIHDLLHFALDPEPCESVIVSVSSKENANHIFTIFGNHRC
jgi:hypothetical protein